MFLMMPQIFLSGATIPMEVMPEWIQQISPAIPLTHVVDLLQGLWFGDAWGNNLVAVAVLVGMLVVGTIVSAKTFRWE
jgi:ABC-2 type transport system permease protein